MKPSPSPSPSISNYIPDNYGNFIDVFIVYLFKPLYPLFKSMSFTPNTITTLSLVFGVWACWTFYNNQYKLSAILLFISYIFDVLDGDYARTYKMVTKFGDYYDHIKDYIVYSCFALIFIMFNNYSKKTLTLIIVISVIFVILCNIIIACKMKYIEKYNKENSSDTLKFLGNLILVKDCKKTMSILKYLDSPTFVLFATILVFFNPQ